MLGWRKRKGVEASEGAARLRQPASATDPEAHERRLLHGVIRQQHADFEALYRLYHPRLQRFLALMTRRPELVDEVLDDTMMVVWQRGSSFDGQTSRLSTWIFGIAYRKALKALSRLDLPQEDPPDAEAGAEPGPDPEQHLSRAQTHARLQRAVACLSFEHRAVVQLCYFHDMSYGEIADVVACPAETVKTRMFYARRRLRVLLSEDEAADRVQGNPQADAQGERP